VDNVIVRQSGHSHTAATARGASSVSVVTPPPSLPPPQPSARAASAARRARGSGRRSCSTLVRLGDLLERLACDLLLGAQRVQLVEVNVLLDRFADERAERVR